MYLKYFGLSVKPFSITPDPRFLYLSAKHREGLAHLLYGTDESSSFVVLTGEVGTGKTTLCRRLLAQVPKGVEFALILNSLQTPLELLASICDEFGVQYDKNNSSRKHLIDQLNQHLLAVHATGKRSVLVIDEAQNLSPETLEQVRLLTNLETGSSKLLKIILLGQPELKIMLARPELRQLAQRVTARHHLESLSPEEVSDYVRHRLKVAGASRSLFTPGAIRKLHQISKGIPRIINLVADRALTGAYGLQKEIVDKNLLSRAATEVSGLPDQGRTGWLRWALATLVLVMITAMAYWWVNQRLILPGSQDSLAAAESGDLPESSIEPSSPAMDVLPEPPELSESLAEEPGDIDQEVVIPEPETVDLGALLSTEEASHSAFPKMFELWKFDYASQQGDSACERARKVGLRCFYTKGTLKDLKYHNLAAVLELMAEGGQRRQAIVTAIDDDHLSMIVGDETYTVSVADLDTYWTGNFLLFWRTSPSGSMVIKPGERSDDVLWLKQQLDHTEVSGGTEKNHSRHYDEKLRRRVMKFQLDNGLYPDGIAGEKTLIKLTAAQLDGSTPILAEVK